MSVNNNNPPKNHGPSSAPFGNAGMVSTNMPTNSNSHLYGQSQFQGQLGVGSQGQFQLPMAQAQAIAAQSKAQAAALAHAKAHMEALRDAQAARFQHIAPATPSYMIRPEGTGAGNFGGSSASVITPSSATVKRVPQKPPARPPGSSNTNTVSPLKPMEVTPAARRKKQKLPDKQLQDKVAALLPESALYTQLLEFESRVDAALARKKVDIQEALKIPPCVQKTLRIYVFNTFSNQVRSVPHKPNAEPPTWTLKVIGRILEDGVDPDQPGAMEKASLVYPKFSSFFKRVSISLDQRLYPDNHIIIWEQSRSPAPQEGFEVKRRGDKEFTANIQLEMNYAPEKFKISPALMEVLGIEVDTRPRIIAAIWHYVKARKLQNPNDPSVFTCDPPLQRVFGEEKMKFTMVSQKISPHLAPPQPIHVEHLVKLSGNSPVGHACYDVLVDIPFPIQRELSALLANTEKNKEIEACDEAICSAIKKIHEHRRRRAFFLGFSQSPVEFINALIESQSRDLKLVAGEPSRSAEKERRSDFFSQPWVEDAVIRYMNRKSVGGNDAPGSA